MTKVHQEYFADQFVRKDLRERVLHEMRKKPDRFEWRLCHDVLGMIDEKAIVFGGDKLNEAQAITQLKKYTHAGAGFLVFCARDGEVVSIEEGVEACFASGGGSAFVMDKVALFKEEYFFGSPDKFIVLASSARKG